MGQMILSDPGINWTWFAHVTINHDDTATINREYRLHKFDKSQGAGRHPKAIGLYKILERPRPDDWQGDGFPPRIAFAVEINGKYHYLKSGDVPRWNFPH